MDQPIFEQASKMLDLVFLDDTGAPVTPTSGTYRVDDADGGTVLKTTTALSISGSTMTLVITPDLNSIINQAREIETRRVFVLFVYGGGKQGTQEYLYPVKNCSGVAR